MEFSQLDLLKPSINEMDLHDLRLSILVEMKNKPVFTPEVSEYLVQAYTDKIAELYW